MPRLTPQRQQVGSVMRTRWYSPGMLVAGVMLLVMYLCGVDLATWWVWLVALVVAAAIDGLAGIGAVQEPKVKTRKSYTRGVQDDD